MSSNKAGTPSRNNRKLVPEPGILCGKEDERAGNSVYHVERFVLLFLNRNARTRNRHFSQGFRESCFYTFQSLLGVGRFSSGRLNDFIEKREMTQFCALSLDWLLEKVLQESVTIDSQALG